MITYLPMTQAREQLTTLSERLAEKPGTVAVTRRGKPVLAILPWELYESIEESLEILSDPELVAALRESIRQAEEGKTVSWDEVRRDLLS